MSSTTLHLSVSIGSPQCCSLLSGFIKYQVKRKKFGGGIFPNFTYVKENLSPDISMFRNKFNVQVVLV